MVMKFAHAGVYVDRQRTGEDMSGLNLQELCQLQESISESVAEIRERKVIILLFTIYSYILEVMLIMNIIYPFMS